MHCYSMSSNSALAEYIAMVTGHPFLQSDSANVIVTHSEYKHRRRRSADVMPSEIHVTVTSKGSDVKFRLKRNTLAGINIPLFTVNRGNHIQQNTDDLLVKQGVSSARFVAACFVTQTPWFCHQGDETCHI